jgi:leucine dehydrogenase
MLQQALEHPDFDQHENVVSVDDSASGLHGLIAIHSTLAGPACGGIRFWHYAEDALALADVLRLSRGMTYQNVMAGLPVGGGKAVIMADAGRQKTPAMLRAFGRAIEALDGAYIGAEDVGMTTADLAVIGETTGHVAGLTEGPAASGNPAPFTAKGVFLGLEAAVKRRLRSDLTGLRVGVLGLGAVGMRLAALLHAAGARLLVADIDPATAEEARARFGAAVLSPAALPEAELDVLAPCALGGVLTVGCVERLKARVVAGAANNQLADPAAGRRLHQRGVLYAPDYVINAGGIINVAAEVAHAYDRPAITAAVERIPATLEEIFVRAEQEMLPSAEVADAIARSRLAALGRQRQARGAAA